MMTRATLAAVVLLVASGAHAKPRSPSPSILDSKITRHHVEPPAGWIAEDPELAADLPRRASSVSEKWFTGETDDGPVVAHCYRLEVGRIPEREVLRRAMATRGVTVPEELHHVRPGVTVVWSGTTAAITCFLSPWTEDNAAMIASWRRTALIAGLLPLKETLGPPVDTIVTVAHETGAEAKVLFDRVGADLPAAAVWLAANGFRGSWEEGWLRVPAHGPRVIVQADTMEDVPVIVIHAVGAPGGRRGR